MKNGEKINADIVHISGQIKLNKLQRSLKNKLHSSLHQMCNDIREKGHPIYTLS